MDTAYWSEQQVYQDVVPLPDGGTQQVSGIEENCFDCWKTEPFIELGTSAQSCGEESHCR